MICVNDPCRIMASQVIYKLVQNVNREHPRKKNGNGLSDVKI